MLTTQLHHALPGFDETLDESQPDFSQAGLKVASIIRVTRLAVASGEMLIGATGNISQERLLRIRNTLSNWLKP
jgi:mRNA interferase MazF